MKSDEFRQVEMALDSLRNMSASHEFCSIMAETGYDEAVIIGTAHAYVDLARHFLEIARAAYLPDREHGKMEREKVDGTECLITSETKHHFDEFADVWPVCAYLTTDRASAEAIKRSLQE